MLSSVRRFVQSPALSRVSPLLNATPSPLSCVPEARLYCRCTLTSAPCTVPPQPPWWVPSFPFVPCCVPSWRLRWLHVPPASSTGSRLHALAAVTSSHIHALSHSVRRLQNMQIINCLWLLIICSYIGLLLPLSAVHPHGSGRILHEIVQVTKDFILFVQGCAYFGPSWN